MVAVEPGGTVGAVHETGPVFGQVQVTPPALTTATDTKVVLFGLASLKVELLQLLGPLLVMVCVYVMLAFAATGLGVPLFVTARSHWTVTGVTTLVLLFADVGSLVVAATDELAVIFPAATVAGILTATTMSAVAPEARALVSLHVMVPVAPTAGEVHVHPTGAVTDSKVVLVGVAWVNTTPVDDAGPLFVTVCV